MERGEDLRRTYSWRLIDQKEREVKKTRNTVNRRSKQRNEIRALKRWRSNTECKAERRRIEELRKWGRQTTRWPNNKLQWLSRCVCCISSTPSLTNKITTSTQTPSPASLHLPQNIHCVRLVSTVIHQQTF